MLWKVLSRKVISFGLLVIFIFGTGIYFIVLLRSSINEKEYILDKQETLLRAEVSNLNSFFSTYGRSLAQVAKRSDVDQEGEESVQLRFDDFVDQWSYTDLVGGIALTDEDGVVVLNSNIAGTRDVGGSLADRDYFLWASEVANNGKYFIGKPVIGRGAATAGAYVFPVASGVYSGEVFRGLVVASVKLDPLMKQFLGSMKISNDTHVHVIDGEGNIYYDLLKPDLVGSNFLKRHHGLDEKLILDAIGNEDKSKFITSSPNAETNSGQDHLFNFAPVALGERKFWLVMHTPYEDKSELSFPLEVKVGTALVFGLVAAVLFRVVGKKARRR